MISRFAKNGYVVDNCYLNDNGKEYTIAFIRLREPSLHEKAIEHFSRVGFELKVEGRVYQLNLGWGSRKQNLEQVVRNLSEQLAKQATIIEEQRLEIEKLKLKHTDDVKDNKQPSPAPPVDLSTRYAFQLRAIKYEVTRVQDRLSVQEGQISALASRNDQQNDDDLKNKVAVLDERLTTTEEALVLSQQIKRRTEESRDSFGQAGLSRVAVTTNPKASNQEKAKRLELNPEADKAEYVCFICLVPTIEIAQAFLRKCSECSGIICSGCERELRLMNTNGDGKVMCAHCRSKKSRYPRLRAFLNAHANK
jgi:hypothetical protein